MRAVIQTEKGGPEVLKIVENHPKPQLRDRDVLVKVTAAAMNPVDGKMRSGWASWWNNEILGYDGVGVVEELGKDAHLFKKGDKVYFAGDVTRNGCHAEYVAVDERIIAKAPTKLTDLESASIPLCTLTAWEAFEERFNLPVKIGTTDKPTQTILIIDGAGGVGSIAIQLAKKVFNLNVIATASRKETIEWCKDLGADHVISHREDMVKQIHELGFTNGVPLLFCCAEAEKSWDQWPNLLSVFGRACLITSAGGIPIGSFMTKSQTVSTELMFTKSMFGVNMESQGVILSRTAELLDQGVLRHTKNAQFTLSEFLKAHELQDSGNAIGKTVLSISN